MFPECQENCAQCDVDHVTCSLCISGYNLEEDRRCSRKCNCLMYTFNAYRWFPIVNFPTSVCLRL